MAHRVFGRLRVSRAAGDAEALAARVLAALEASGLDPVALLVLVGLGRGDRLLAEAALAEALEEALAAGRRPILVLLGDVAPPPPDMLPPGLRGLPAEDVIAIRAERFDADLARLLARLAALSAPVAMGVSMGRPQPSAPAPVDARRMVARREAAKRSAPEAVFDDLSERAAATGRMRRESLGGAPADGTPVASVDRVTLSAFAPRRVRPRARFAVQAALHLPAERALVERLIAEAAPRATAKGSRFLQQPVARGERLTVEIEAPAFGLTRAAETVTWSGDAVILDFELTAPFRLLADTLPITLRVRAGDVWIGKHRFEVTVARRGPGEERTAREGFSRYRTAFLSYAKEDRAVVAAVANAYAEAGVAHFFDVDTLRAGDDWKAELERHVNGADLFLLYWSKAAAGSRWVAQEAAWARAIRDRAPDYRPDIKPYFLGADAPPPPAVLADLHFERLQP